MKLKNWIEVVGNSKTVYPLVKQFIEEGYGQEGGYDVKSGNNEKEHCIIYWKTKDLEKEYKCDRLRCHEMLLHIAYSFGISEIDLNELYKRVVEYVKTNGRKLTSISPIAIDVMDIIKETETFKKYETENNHTNYTIWR